MTKYERELAAVERELKHLPRAIRQTKSRGARLRKAQKAYRKAQTKVERCRIACLALPKHWQSYAPTKTRRGDTYARREVSEMHTSISQLKWAQDTLESAQERYDSRFTDRQEYRQELQTLPDRIACLKSLIEIAEKKRKPKKEKDPRSAWIEVAPGYVVEKHRVVTYCKTLKTEPIKNVSGGFYVLSHPGGYIKFAMKRLQEKGGKYYAI